ncbi:MAG TPA: carboxypeptidase regulatory-like domain-containing protein [Vicinamibacteria bacterium]|nr:carboxypeptidase regulatory-like domain-containing protein [Vicinamibacteria bacterium]
MPIAKRLAVAGALLVVLGLDSTPSWAQFTSAIEGTVTDPSGAVLPGATVAVTNEATGVAQTRTTTGAGYYRFPALPGGLYTVRVSLDRFRASVLEHLRVESGQIRTVNVALELGEAGAEEVTVTAEAPLVDMAQGRISGLIEEDQVKDLPLIGRNFFNLVVLTPGVTGRATGGSQSYAQAHADLYNNEFGVGMNANGARTESNNFMIDSATVSSSQRSGVANVNPNSESVEEIRVSVNNFSAEYGRNGSVLVNVITKSGTNDWHGSVGAYYTNQSLQEKDHFQKQSGANLPDFDRREFTWGLGGPVFKDRTFFFVSGDVLRSDVAISANRSIITPQFISFMQQARPNNISTRIARDFPASFTPTQDFRTAGQHLGASCSGATLISSPIGPVPCNLPVTGVGTWNETSPRNGFQWSARLDHHFNEGKDRLYASVIRTTTDKVGFGAPEVYPDFTASSPTNSLHLATNWTKIWGSNVVNELSFSWVRPYGELENPYPEIPGMSVQGLSQNIQVGWGPNTFVQNSFIFSDVVTWTRGSHNLKVGGAYTREHADNDSGRAVTRPTYRFESVFDFANDDPLTQSQIAVNPITGTPLTSIVRFHRTQSLSAFVQDDWKVNPHFTLNFGVRYEGFLNIYNAANDMTNLQFGELGPATGNLRNDILTARMVPRKYYLDGGLFGGGQHTLAPRVSFAWDPTKEGKLSIRGGIGRAYERMSNQIWDGEHNNLPRVASATADRRTAVAPIFSLGTAKEPPYGYTYPAGIGAGVNQHGGLARGAAQVITVDGDIPAMYLDNWFLGVQRGFGRHVVAEANYIGSRGRNMYTRWDINRFAGDLFDGRLDRILPGFTAIQYAQAIDKSHYHGGTLSVKVNRSDLQLGAAYTLGRAIDRSISATPPQRQDAYGPDDQDEGPSDFDIRSKIAVSMNWKLPGPSSGAGRAILGGWQLAGVLIRQSGSPFSVICNRAFAPIRDAAGAVTGNSGCDYNADGTSGDRPNTPAFGDSLGGLSNDDFLTGIFRASDFPTPAPGTSGNLGRNTFRGPRYFNVDLALIKSFRVGGLAGGSDFQLRLEAFNALNTLNLFNPVNDMGNPLFGRSTQALQGRIIQFSARFAF